MISIPDFGLCLLLHRNEAERADALGRRLFDADELALAPSTEARVVAAAERLNARQLAALVLDVNDGDEALRSAIHAARAAHAPITALLVGDASAPDNLPSASAREISRLKRVPPPCDRRGETGPFDIIGDVHGCYDELVELLIQLGWSRPAYRKGETLLRSAPPEGRRAVFVGDLVDRGPRNADALRLVMGMVADGSAFAVMGNHDYKLARLLKGANVKRSHGLAETEQELLTRSARFRSKVEAFLEARPDHLWLDGGALIVAHAGLPADMHGRASKEVRRFALFGDVSGGARRLRAPDPARLGRGLRP